MNLIFPEESESIQEKQNLANSYTEAGLYDDAQNIYEDIIDIKKTILGQYNLELVSSYYDLHNLYMLRDNPKKAEEYLKMALDLQYINFLFAQKKYIPTLVKYQELYSYQKDSIKSAEIDSLIFTILNMNKDTTMSLIDTTMVYPEILTLKKNKIDSSNFVSEFSLNDKAIELIESGITYMGMGVYSETIRLFDEAIKLNAEVLNIEYLLNLNFPDSTMLNSLYGAYNEIEQFDSTITTKNLFLAILDIKQNENTEKIISNLKNYSLLYPKDIKSYLLLGDLYLREEEYIEAISSYFKVLLLDQNNLRANLNLAVCLLELEKYHDAITKFNFILEIDANNEESYFGLGLAHFNLNDYQKAIDFLTQAILLNPSNSTTYFLIAESYKNLAKKKQAMESYKMCIKLNPENGEAHFELALIYESIFKIDEALKHYSIAKKYLETDSLNYNYGILLYSEEDFSSALSPLRAYIINNPYDYDILEILGDIFFKENRFSEAVDTYNRLIDFDPNNKFYYNQIADSYLILENFKEAKIYFDKVLSFNEEDTEILFKLGKISNILKQFAEAEKYFIESIYCNYKSKDLLFQLGLSFGAQKKYLQALEAFKEALQFSLDDPILHYQLGVIYQELEIFNLAIESYEKYLLNFSDDAIVYRMIGECYLQEKKYSDSIDYLKKASKLYAYKDFKSIYLIGLSYMKLEDFSNAAKYFKQGIKLNSDDAMLHFHLIDVYQSLGKLREASKECEILYMLDRKLYYSSRFCN